MRRLQSIVGSLVALTMILFGAGAHAQTVDEIIKRGKVVIAVDVTTPPYGRMGANGEPEGHEPDFARLFPSLRER